MGDPVLLRAFTKWETPWLFSFGLPTARAPAHNLLGQQGLKISTPTFDASQAVQSNEDFLPQEAIDDLRRPGAAADKR